MNSTVYPTPDKDPCLSQEERLLFQRQKLPEKDIEMNAPSPSEDNNGNNKEKNENIKDTDSLIPKSKKDKKRREKKDYEEDEEDEEDEEENNRPSLTRLSYLEVPTIVIPKENENSKKKRNIPWKSIFTHKCVYAMYISFDNI